MSNGLQELYKDLDIVTDVNKKSAMAVAHYQNGRW